MTFGHHNEVVLVWDVRSDFRNKRLFSFLVPPNPEQCRRHASIACVLGWGNKRKENRTLPFLPDPHMNCAFGTSEAIVHGGSGNGKEELKNSQIQLGVLSFCYSFLFSSYPNTDVP